MYEAPSVEPAFGPEPRGNVWFDSSYVAYKEAFAAVDLIAGAVGTVLAGVVFISI